MAWINASGFGQCKNAFIDTLEKLADIAVRPDNSTRSSNKNGVSSEYCLIARYVPTDTIGVMTRGMEHLQYLVAHQNCRFVSQLLIVSSRLISGHCAIDANTRELLQPLGVAGQVIWVSVGDQDFIKLQALLFNDLL